MDVIKRLRQDSGIRMCKIERSKAQTYKSIRVLIMWIVSAVCIFLHYAMTNIKVTIQVILVARFTSFLMWRIPIVC